MPACSACFACRCACRPGSPPPTLHCRLHSCPLPSSPCPCSSPEAQPLESPLEHLPPPPRDSVDAAGAAGSGIAFVVDAEVPLLACLLLACLLPAADVSARRPAPAALLEHRFTLSGTLSPQVTGYLMMGALTPNCKKHSGKTHWRPRQAAPGARAAAFAGACCFTPTTSRRTRRALLPPSHPRCAAAVTLFEGGRVYGADVINELIEELHTSVEMSVGFEGEMRALVDYAR